MNRFYTLPIAVQWMIAILLLVVVVVLLVAIMALTERSFFWYFLIFPVVPIFHFCTTPFFRLTKAYTYVSPMLLVYSASDEKYDLHNGTGFDYWMTMRGTPSGAPMRSRLLSYYMEGLLNIIQKIERGELPGTVEVHGTSYFFSENTAKRFGFSIKEPTSFYLFNLYFNYFELLWMYSISKGKLAFPNLKNIKLASTTGSALVQEKAKIEIFYAYLNKRSGRSLAE